MNTPLSSSTPLLRVRGVAKRYGDRVGVEYRQREPGVIVIDFSVH